ncbi:MAG TPA: SRPBCC domain-containing protein, partial [Gemmataceae bacterium]
MWEILTSAPGYAEWNPEIVAIEGRMEMGERIQAQVKVGGGAIRTVPLRVTVFEAPSRMEWTGGLPLGLFTGRRIFTVTPGESAVEFHMLVQMSGLLASLMVKAVGDRQSEIDAFSS